MFRLAQHARPHVFMELLFNYRPI